MGPRVCAGRGGRHLFSGRSEPSCCSLGPPTWGLSSAPLMVAWPGSREVETQPGRFLWAWGGVGAGWGWGLGLPGVDGAPHPGPNTHPASAPCLRAAGRRPQHAWPPARRRARAGPRQGGRRPRSRGMYAVGALRSAALKPWPVTARASVYPPGWGRRLPLCRSLTRTVVEGPALQTRGDPNQAWGAQGLRPGWSALRWVRPVQGPLLSPQLLQEVLMELTRDSCPQGPGLPL